MFSVNDFSTWGDEMIQAIRQEVTVLPGGCIELRSPELREGMHAEVVIFLPEKPASQLQLSGLIGKGKGAYNSPREADRFIRKERDEWE